MKFRGGADEFVEKFGKWFATMLQEQVAEAFHTEPLAVAARFHDAVGPEHQQIAWT